MKNVLRHMKLWQKFAALGVIGTVMCAVPEKSTVGLNTMVRPCRVTPRAASLLDTAMFRVSRSASSIARCTPLSGWRRPRKIRSSPARSWKL